MEDGDAPPADAVVPKKRNKIPTELPSAAEDHNIPGPRRLDAPATVQRSRLRDVENPEERVVGTGANTFEELLERKLREGESQDAFSRPRQANEKREFLRKGSRTARTMPSSSHLVNRSSVSSSHSSTSGAQPHAVQGTQAATSRSELPQSSITAVSQSSRSLVPRQLSVEPPGRGTQPHTSQPRPFLKKGSGQLGSQRGESSSRPSSSTQLQPKDVNAQKARKSSPSKPYVPSASGYAAMMPGAESDDEDFENLERRVMEEDDLRPTRTAAAAPRPSRMSDASVPQSSPGQYTSETDPCWATYASDEADAAFESHAQTFHDSQKWDDVEEEFLSDGDEATITHQARLRTSETAKLSEPPVSGLVERLFNKRQKPGKRLESTQKQRGQQEIAHATPKSSAPLESTSAVLPDDLEVVLRQKLRALDDEIIRFKAETERLKKLSDAHDKEHAQFEQARAAFERSRGEEIEQFELLKADELKKLKKERRLVEQQAKMNAMYAANAKREREELDSVRAELSKLKEEAIVKESKLKATADRLQRRVDELSAKTKELERELADKDAMLVSYEQREALRKKEALRSKSPLVRYPTLRNDDYAEAASSEHHNFNGTQSASESGPVVRHTERRSPIDRSTQSTPDAHVDLPRHAPLTTKPGIVEPSTSMADSPAQYLKEAFKESFAVVERMQERRKKLQESSSIRESILPDGKVEHEFSDGSKLTCFVNQTRKITEIDGNVALYFTNGDIKKTYPDGKVLYFYAEAHTVHTTLPDGIEIFAFSSGQVERHFPSGRKQILFSDGTLKNMGR